MIHWLPLAFEIHYASLLLHYLLRDSCSVLMYKCPRFLVEILDFLAFYLCHTFQRHILSKCKTLGHLNLLLYPPQCSQNFIYIFQRQKQKEVQTTWMHTYGCYFLLSCTHMLDPVLFVCLFVWFCFFLPQWLWKMKQQPFICVFGRSSQITLTFAVLKYVSGMD